MMVTNGKLPETVRFHGFYWILITSIWDLVGTQLNPMWLLWDTHVVRMDGIHMGIITPWE